MWPKYREGLVELTVQLDNSYGSRYWSDPSIFQSAVLAKLDG